MLSGAINASWEGLRAKVAEEFAKSKINAANIEYRHCLRVQYVGQLNDVEIDLPFSAVKTADDVRTIIAKFEEAFSKQFSRAARSPELGYLVTTVVIRGIHKVVKPVLPQEPVAGPSPVAAAYKEGRQIYRHGKWHDAAILEMEKLAPGNVVMGPAVIESSATTLVVPPGAEVALDQHRIFHLRHLA